MTIGDKFGKWTVISGLENINYRSFVSVRCDCGNIRKVQCYALRNGRTKGCGCVKFIGKKTCPRCEGTGRFCTKCFEPKECSCKAIVALCGQCGGHGKIDHQNPREKVALYYRPNKSKEI